MFDTSWIADLDAASACEAVRGTQDDLREAEWREIALAAHWATLHGPESIDAAEARRPGREQLKRAGGLGTPFVAQFACGELALLMGSGYAAADSLIRDAVDLQHRHPLLWAALAEGHGRVWKARRVARMCREAGLDREQAWFVDTATTPYLDTLCWAACERLVEAKIIEADPAAAERRRLAAAMERFVVTGQTNEHGLKTLIAKASAGDVIFLVAMCDRVAQILAMRGDTDSLDVRRSKALGLLANPAEALELLQAFSADEPHPDDPDRTPLSSVAAERERSANRCQGCGGRRTDPDSLRPHATLVVRISELALRTGAGVAVCDQGVGPLPAEALRDLLGHVRVTVRPLLDLRGQVPVDAYEVPAPMRDALRLARPSSVFPFSQATGAFDVDHSTPFVPLDQGGAAGQTRIGNLGPMSRFGHRVKTFGRGWRMSEPSPGVYLWRTPHGYWFRVDNDGTHPLGRDPDVARGTGGLDQQVRRSDPEHGPPGEAA